MNNVVIFSFLVIFLSKGSLAKDDITDCLSRMLKLGDLDNVHSVREDARKQLALAIKNRNKEKTLKIRTQLAELNEAIAVRARKEQQDHADVLFSHAADDYLALGLYHKAAKMSTKAGEFAAANAKKASSGGNNLATRALERSAASNYRVASDRSAQVGDRQSFAANALKSAGHYEKLGQYDDAIMQYIHAGNVKKAMEIVSRQRNNKNVDLAGFAGQRIITEGSHYLSLANSIRDKATREYAERTIKKDAFDEMHASADVYLAQGIQYHRFAWRKNGKNPAEVNESLAVLKSNLQQSPSIMKEILDADDLSKLAGKR